MMNSVNLMGRLTVDPELRRTANGTACCSFSIAVDRNTKEKTADFIRVVAWRGTAEFISRYFEKGKMIALTGRLQSRSYEKDGKKNTVTEVVAEEVFFAGSKHGNSEPASDGSPAEESFVDISDADIGSIPF